MNRSIIYMSTFSVLAIAIVAWAGGQSWRGKPVKDCERSLAKAIEYGSEEGEDDVELLLDQCPAPVQKTIKRESSGGQIVEIELEGARYEADIEIGSNVYEVEVLADGTLLRKHVDDDDD